MTIDYEVPRCNVCDGVIDTPNRFGYCNDHLDETLADQEPHTTWGVVHAANHVTRTSSACPLCG